MRSDGSPRFSIRDLLVLVTVAAVLLAIGLPAISAARESARRMSCSNNFRQIGLSFHNYHSAFKTLPAAMGGTESNGSTRSSNAGRLNGLIALTPFVESTPTWDTISNPLTHQGIDYPAMGPVPWDLNYPPWKIQYPTFRCPSQRPAPRPFGTTNYLFCIGDSARNVCRPASLQQTRGAFAGGIRLRFVDITDGLSNTVAMTETANSMGSKVVGQFVIDGKGSLAENPQLCFQEVDPNRPKYFADNTPLSDLGRGGNWADGAAGYAMVQTVLPPNSPSCAIGGTSGVDGVFSATSLHMGGCHVLFCDGAVVFATESIDTGDLTLPTPHGLLDADQLPIPSPYGVWGALGTRAGGEGDVGFSP